MIYLACILECIINAFIDSRKIKRNKKVNHEANAGLYIGLVVVCCAFTDYWQAIPLLCLRPLIFDNVLNLLRGKPLMYQPINPDSVVDKFENAVFGHKKAWAISNLLYLIGFILGVWLI